MSEATFFDIISPAPPPSLVEDVNTLPIVIGILLSILFLAAASRWLKARPLRRAKKRLVEIRAAYQNAQLDSRLAAYLIAFELRRVVQARHLNPAAAKNKAWLALQAALADLRYPRVTTEKQYLEEVFKLALRWLKRPGC